MGVVSAVGVALLVQNGLATYIMYINVACEAWREGWCGVNVEQLDGDGISGFASGD